MLRNSTSWTVGTRPPASGAPLAAPGLESGAIITTGNTVLGAVVTDRDGRTVYAFTNDTPGATPTCVDECATNWPPVIVAAVPTPAGSIDGTKLGVVARADGNTQATYGGFPLYYFAVSLWLGGLHRRSR